MSCDEIKACIFDFDGVIVDSEKYHHRAWQWLADELGVEFTYEEYAPFKSAGRRKVIPYLFQKAGRTFTEEDLAHYSRLREQHAAAALSHLSQKDITPGLIDFVRYIKSQGVKCAVASASSSSHKVAERLGLYDLFDLFVDGDANLPYKPNPDIFLYTANKLDVPKHQCVVFEDSINGIRGAIAADMSVIGVQSYFTQLAPTIENFENLTLQRIRELCKTKFQT